MQVQRTFLLCLQFCQKMYSLLTNEKQGKAKNEKKIPSLRISCGLHIVKK